jgi:hypothetical protein
MYDFCIMLTFVNVKNAYFYNIWWGFVKLKYEFSKKASKFLHHCADNIDIVTCL